MDLELRPLAEDEWDEALRVDGTAFGEDPADAAWSAAWRGAHDADRSLGMFEQTKAVAVTSARAFDLTVPGLRLLPITGVTGMAVLPTYRRQGLLRRMMRHQLDDAVGRGDAMAALTASESTIYGRFGFGPATSEVAVELDTAHAGLAEPSHARVRLLDRGEAPEVLPPVLDRTRLAQPGDVNRSPEWWALLLVDSERDRDGATELMHVVHDAGAEGPDGYATYRVKAAGAHGLPRSKVLVDELVAAGPEAFAALWQYLLQIDLVDVVEVRRRPVEDPLRWLLADPRRMRATMLADQLWVRLLDVEAALAARRYPLERRLVLEVADAFRPASGGRFRLDGGPDGAECRRTADQPDLSLDAATLASLYLGGVAATTLAAAGRVVEHSLGAAAGAGAMFASQPPPYCTTPF